MKYLFEILSITGFIQGILVGSLAIFHEKFKKSEFTILGILIVLMGIDCLCQSVLVVSNYPFIYWINNGNLLLFGPLFYFFVKIVKTEVRISRFEVLLHLIPFIVIKLGTLILGPSGLGEELLPTSFYTILNQLISIQGVGYAILALSMAIQNRDDYSNSLKQFAFWLAIIYSFGWVSSILGRQLEWYDVSTSMILWSISYLALLIMIFAITVQLILYSENTKQEGSLIKPLNKYERSTLALDESQRLEIQLQRVLQEDKLFLDPELNRSKLAQHLNVSPHTLSQVLNNHLHKSFSEYINEFRLNEAKKRLIDPAYKEYTILAIAFDSGFKSKSSFQRLFKKHTGHTPSKYIAAMKKV